MEGLSKEPQDRMKKSGVILYHPQVCNYHQIYNFRNALLNGYINHFQLGMDPSLQDQPSAESQYSCIRLFSAWGCLPAAGRTGQSARDRQDISREPAPQANRRPF